MIFNLMYANMDSARTVRIGVHFLCQFPHSDAQVEILCYIFQDSDYFLRPDLFAALGRLALTLLHTQSSSMHTFFVISMLRPEK